MLVLGLVSERQSQYEMAQGEIGRTWGASQTVVGPVLVFTKPPFKDTTTPVEQYVLPRSLKVESVLTPEVRSRGIYDTVVYTETLKVSGVFAKEDMGGVPAISTPTLVVALSDARSIETQVALTWGTATVPFQPGPNARMFTGAGIHALVPYSPATTEYPFSFELTIKGTGEAFFVPVGGETEVTVTSPWKTPAFTGAFLPSERTLSDTGFNATWHVSSFGRNYPQTWEGADVVSFATLAESAFGVSFFDGVDLYTQLFRSIKYSVLFIVITFTVFFLFEVLQKVRVHPIQYLLIGSALALFYLLLLSLAEQIGFLYAYLLATAMTTLLVVGYSASVLKQKSRALLVGVQLMVLYGYLYFVLKLEDYALLFGALLLFALLASVMYLTRNVDWFTLGRREV
jgi:inner membrane protein